MTKFSHMLAAQTAKNSGTATDFKMDQSELTADQIIPSITVRLQVI